MELIEFLLLDNALALKQSFGKLVIFLFNTLVFSPAYSKIETLRTLGSSALTVHDAAQIGNGEVPGHAGTLFAHLSYAFRCWDNG